MRTAEILYFDGCPNHAGLAPRILELAAAAGVEVTLEHRKITDGAAAQRERFLGSPSVRIDGRDVEPGADQRRDFGMGCRVYATPEGIRGAPSDAWIRDAIARARPAGGA
jgi:hypothetical protein